MKNRIEAFKDKLNKDIAVGHFVCALDPAFTEIAGTVGFDFAIFDMEHGSATVETMQNHMRAADVGKIFPIIRVPNFDKDHINKALDIGALGVQVPMINSAEEAEAVVAASKYHPLGTRGMSPVTRAAKYCSIDILEYMDTAKDSMIILQIETEEAVKNIEKIVKVRNIDAIFIGAYDLSVSLGIPGQVQNEEVISRMEHITKCAKEAGITPGTIVTDKSGYDFWTARGHKYMAYSVDLLVYSQACKSYLKSIRG